MKLKEQLNSKVMKSQIQFRVGFIILMVFTLVSCTKKDSGVILPKLVENHFDPHSLKIDDKNSIKKIRGQVLYLPIYSNIPYYGDFKKIDLSAFIAIHNTDIKYPITITKVLYFNNDGKLVANYLQKDTTIHPFGATNFYVPTRDQSGTGANFLIEWVSDSLVNEPLIESVMIGLATGQGVSFLSTGKVLRELR